MKAFVLATLLLSVMLHAAEPLRVGLQPLKYTQRPTPEQRALAAVSFYLRERLAQCPSVAVVDDARARSIFSQLSGRLTYQTHNGILPIDVLIDCRTRKDSIAIFLARAGGEEVLSLSVKDLLADFPAAMRTIARELKLTAVETTRLTDPGMSYAPGFLLVYGTRTETAAYPANTGEIRLKQFSPHLKKSVKDVRVQAAIVEDAGIQLSSTTRDLKFNKAGAGMGLVALPQILGTDYEFRAHRLLRLKPALFEPLLLRLTAPLVAGNLDVIMGDLDDAADDAIVAQAEKTVPLAWSEGALRLLGIIQSKTGLQRIIRAGAGDTPSTRAAAAYALAQYEGNAKAAAQLQKLKSDAAPRVAFLCLWGRRRKETATLAAAARKAVTTMDLPVVELHLLLQAIAATPLAEDRQVLRRCAHHPIERIRTTSRRGLDRLAAANPEAISRLLRSTDSRTVLAGIAALPKELEQDDLAQLKHLAQSPHGKLAAAAVTALAPFRPKDPRQARLFDLETAPSLVRHRVVDQLRARGTPEAVQDLTQAASGHDGYIRAYALRALAAIAPEQATPIAVKGLTDTHDWVRLQAAALLATRAQPQHGKAIAEAIAAEKNIGVTLYLKDALAKAKGQPKPARRPAARNVKARQNMTWLCGIGRDAESSPFQGYYVFKPEPSEVWKKAYAKGKVVFARISCVGNPGQIIVSGRNRNSFWRQIDAQLTDANLPYLDGVVLGEETMSMNPSTLWNDGWRQFCRDAAIDTNRIGGKVENLNPDEKRAWINWALSRSVEGFNAIYDYIKLRFGRQRPGLQVCTFLPIQGLHGSLVPPNFNTWKFDVAGIYHYKGDSRMAAYNLVRRYKTHWPERPILWLSLGIGGYEMNPVKWNRSVPERPLMYRTSRSYADTVTAWLAGADAGWFSIWIFISPTFKRGKSMSGVVANAESIGADSPDLKRGIDHAFRGVEKILDRQALGKPIIGDNDNDLGMDDLDDIELDAGKKTEERDRKIAASKEKMRRGFGFYQQYVYDCVRVFNSLPRRNPKPKILAVRADVSVWSRPPTANPLVPGMALLNEYDFVADLDQVVNLDLSRYRMIVVRDPDKLRDQTITALTKWLKDTPGLLYINPFLPAEDNAEAGTAADHDGKLTLDWPWENDVQTTIVEGYPASKRTVRRVDVNGRDTKTSLLAVHAATFTVKGAARGLLTVGKKPVLALWHNPKQYRGAVLFDGLESASGQYLERLRDEINRIHQTAKVGLPLTGPRLQVLLRDRALQATAASRYYTEAGDESRLAGLDLLTGEANPKIGRAAAAIVGADYTNRHVANGNGINALAETPFTKAEVDGKTLVLQAAGLIRVAAGNANINIKTTSGKPIPRVDDPLQWLLSDTTEGLAVLAFGPTKRQVVYVRSQHPLAVTTTRTSE